jgi:lysozyme family protein
MAMNIIERIMLTEGGYVNDPQDAGGETKYGVSKRAHPDLDIKNLTKHEAEQILINDYIVLPGFNDLPNNSLRDQLIDFGYHSGPPRAIRTLQALLGVRIDGTLGPRTAAAILARDANHLNNQLAVKRAEFLVDIIVEKPSQLKYARGWVKRALSFIV